MEKKRGALAAALAVASLLAPAGALAAGGHHGVDDANILSPGRCEQEDWFSRDQEHTRLLHAGFNCGVGPVELGVAGEHARGGDASAAAWNVEAKWATQVVDGLKIGWDLQPVWQVNQRPRSGMTRVVGLATWTPDPAWSVHLNLGHDFVRRGPDFGHYGVGVDWAPIDRWTFTGEGFADQGTRFVRAGARWALTGHLSLDFSRAQRVSGPAPSNYTLGVTFGFD